MWVLTLVVLNLTCNSGKCAADYKTSPAIVAVEYTSKEKCVLAANIANKRNKVWDAWCTPK